jgi:hypothetical protein
MKKICTFFSLFIISIYSIFAQSLTVFDIDTSAFPTMKAKFYAFDADGKQITNLSPSDFSVTENGIIRTVLSVSCPAPKDPGAISSVLVNDVSGSMCGGPLDMVKTASNTWIDMMNLKSSECAITSFSDYNYLNQDFTTDKNKLINAIQSLSCINGTDYNAGMLTPAAGGIPIVKTGKHKRIIVFLSDGYPNFEPNTSQIISQALQNNIIIYCIAINNPAAACMKEFSNQTGGLYFENIKSTTEIKDCYRKILFNATNLNSCSIEWESVTQCSYSNISALIKLTSNGTKDSVIYKVPLSFVANLRIIPNGVYFKNRAPGFKYDTTVTITAINSDFKIINITSSNSIFSVTPSSLNLKSGESKPLTISYTPVDSNTVFSNFNVISDLCPATFYANGIFTSKRKVSQTLKLTNPNGGEQYVVGSDSIITWEGISPSDKVILEYSIDSGKTWIKITDTATNLIYYWKNIPKTPSNKCLMKISPYSNDSPEIEWKKCFGGGANDQANSIQETSDGGYIVAGSTNSSDGDVSGLHWNTFTDYWVVKLTKDGVIEWQKCLGGSDDEVAYSIEETRDGGYIVAGSARSSDGNVTGKILPGDVEDFWVVKLTKDGIIEWQKCLGGSSADIAYSIHQTNDYGYIVAGYTCSSDTDVTSKHGTNGDNDCWIVKLTSYGSIDWQKCFGGSDKDWANSIQETSDSGYVVACAARSNDGDVIGRHGPWNSEDFWILKLTSSGSIAWQKCLGGTGADIPYSIQQTYDRGYIVAGVTWSEDGDVIGKHFGVDSWIVKLTSSGNIEWQKCLGGFLGYQESPSVQQTNDGGYIFASYLDSLTGNLTGNHGYLEYLVVKFTSMGTIEWQKSFGGSLEDKAKSIQQTNDGGYIVAGYTLSNNGDVTGNHGGSDCWIVKLAPDNNNTQSDISDSLWAIVSPITLTKDIDMKQCLLGKAKDSVITSFLTNTGNYKCRFDSIYFIGADSSAFGITSGIPPFELASGTSKDVEFRFVPSRVGEHYAQVVVITQSDILITNIKGEGVLPQLEIVNKLIDFGRVYVGSQKDTIQAVTIKNVSNYPLSIINTKHNKPNDYDFSTLAGGGAFTLQPGDTCKMNLRFKPSDKGRTSGTLEFYYNGLGSPAVVQLFGNGIIKPKIEASDSLTTNIYCGSEIYDTILISNSGDEPLIISEADLSGQNPDEFIINSNSLPLTIDPGYSSRLLVKFLPKSLGSKTAELVLKSNSNPDSIFTVHLIAIKDSISIVPSFSNIDLGILCPNETKDTVFNLKNMGTLGSGVSINSSGLFDINPTTQELNIGEASQISLHFKGLPGEGDLSEIIHVIDQTCGFEIKINVKAKIEAPRIETNDLILSSIIGSYIDSMILLKNNSDRNVLIINPPIIADPRFTLINPQFPMTIPAQGSQSLTIRYSPIDKTTLTTNMILYGEPCNVSKEIILNGTNYIPVLQVGNAEAFPSDIVIIPVYLNNPIVVANTSITEIKTDLTFNSTLLYPLSEAAGTIQKENRTISLSIPYDKTNKTAHKDIRFRAALGNDSTTSLALTNISATGTTIEMKNIDGTFTLLGVCHEGGPRLYIPTGKAEIMMIKPNPASDELNIELNLIESGETSLDIINSQGIVLDKIKLDSDITGVKELKISTNGLSSGFYLIKLQTPTVISTKNVLIYK